MRNAIIEEIYNQMKERDDIFFLTGDLGYETLEKIEKDFPTRFINVGIAEQNMMGIASGLALSGKKVYVYSIIPFLTMRCFEQIRNDICYHDLDVTLLGAGAGISYGILSSTHFALEDIAILRSLPNMNIFSPCDEVEAIIGMKLFEKHKHPLYVRIGKRKEPIINRQAMQMTIGNVNIISEGKDIVFFSTGPIIKEVILAAESLKKENINAAVISVPFIKPIDRKQISEICKNISTVFTIEEHFITGGLGSVICEIVSEFNPGVKVKRIGVKDEFIKMIGSQEYLRKELELDVDGIAATVKRSLKFII